MLERKHIEAIERCFEHYAMLGNKESFEAVIAAISAALAAADESPWRSMESAPKDGTRIACGWYESRRIERNCVYDSDTGEWGYRGRLVGIVLYDPQPDFWHPEFPPMPAAPEVGK